MRSLKQLDTLERCSLALAAALLLCLLPWPYGFYSVIRLAVAVTAGCWAYTFFRKGETARAVIAAATALLFQPFFKIELGRLTWNIVDVALAACIILLIFGKQSVKARGAGRIKKHGK